MTESNRILAEAYKEQLLKTFSKSPAIPVNVPTVAPPPAESPPPVAVPAQTETAPIDAPCRLGDHCGLLAVNVTTAKGALPIAGAHISVTDENGAIMAFLTTDISGKTHAISLPTPPESLSENPENTLKPYAAYNVLVTAEGFYPVEVLKIPIFDTVQSIQPIDLVPLREYETDPHRTITYTTIEPDL